MKISSLLNIPCCREVNAALANSNLAYELQVAKIQQKISTEEVQIDVAIRRKEIEIEDREIQRKEKELVSTVKLPAEAESYKVQVLAEGKRYINYTSTNVQGLIFCIKFRK